MVCALEKINWLVHPSVELMDFCLNGLHVGEKAWRYSTTRIEMQHQSCGEVACSYVLGEMSALAAREVAGPIWNLSGKGKQARHSSA